MVFLETERLILRQVKPEDADTIHDYRNNEICARYQRGQTRDREKIVELVENRSRDTLSVEANAMIGVALKETDELVGEIIVMPNDGAISLGYTFSYKHHRKGFAFEALSALIAYLHRQYPDWEFISFTDPENVPSMNLLKKLGYEHLGYASRMLSEVFGKWVKENPLQDHP